MKQEKNKGFSKDLGKKEEKNCYPETEKITPAPNKPISKPYNTASYSIDN